MADRWERLRGDGLPVDHDNDVACGSEEGSYLRLVDFCITQLKAQGPSRTCNDSKEEGRRVTWLDRDAAEVPVERPARNNR